MRDLRLWSRTARLNSIDVGGNPSRLAAEEQVRECREAEKTKSFVVVGVVATGVIGYAIAYWLANMTEYAERIDRERDRRQSAAQAGLLAQRPI